MPTLSPPRPAPAGLPGTHGGRDRVSRTSGGGLRSRAGRLWPCGSHSRCHSLCRVCLPRPLPLVSAASSPLAPPAPQPRPGHRARPGNAGPGRPGTSGERRLRLPARRPRDARVTGGHLPLKKTTIFLTVKARFTLDWASQTWTGRELPGDPAAARLWIREVWGRDGGAGCLTSSRRRGHCWPGGPLRASRI